MTADTLLTLTAVTSLLAILCALYGDWHRTRARNLDAHNEIMRRQLQAMRIANHILWQRNRRLNDTIDRHLDAVADYQAHMLALEVRNKDLESRRSLVYRRWTEGWRVLWKRQVEKERVA